MAEESDLEKTEDPSPQRLQKAREEGQVPRSREWSTFALLAVGGGALWVSSGVLQDRLAGGLRQGLAFERAVGFDSSRMLAQAGAMSVNALVALAPFLGAMFAAALLAPMALGGLVVAPKALAPDFSRLDPLAGLARLFSLQGAAELAKTLAKSFLIGWVAWLAMRDGEGAIRSLIAQPARVAVPQALAIVARSCAWMVGALLVVALLDVPYQVWALRRKLRMSREDLKQERKDSEGDPQIKARIRRQQQAMARRRMMSEVPKADLVLTNPTHFAVALRYDDASMGAPRLVAKGSDLVAQRICALAREHGVEVLESPPLARSLYKHTELGREIPAGLYTAVAEVLAWLYQVRRWRAAGGTEPPRPGDPAIPAALLYPVPVPA